MSQYIHFTNEQKEQARQTDLVSLLESQGETLKRSGKEFEWKDGSAKVTVRGNLWYHQYDREGGDAIDFVRRYYNKSYPEAVEFLLGGCGGTLITSPPVVKEAKPFELPPKNGTMRRVYAYLIKHRCIDSEVWSTSSSASSGSKSITPTGNSTYYAVWQSNINPSISLSSTSETMSVGENITLTATTVPSNQYVTWSSSNSSVATVSNGIVTAIGSGTATITAKFTYNGTTYSKTCYITVTSDVLLGDVNGDGIVDAADAGLISRYDAGLINLTAEQLQAGDVNKDGEVDAGDAGIISRYDAGLITTLG